MHPTSHFSVVQLIWTLTFAAQLVLLVVLLGRDRIKRFPWFTVSISLLALRMLSTRLLFGRMPQMTLSLIFVPLALVSALISILVLVEVARRAFAGAKRLAWINGTLGVLTVCAVVMTFWGPWPALKTLFEVDSQLAVLRLVQFLTQKSELLSQLISIQLLLLVVFLGRSFKAGWRSHVQQILIGLSTVSISQLAVQISWESIARSAAPKSQAEVDHLIGLRDNLFNASEMVYIAVLIWWIICLWIEPRPSASENGVPEIEWMDPKDAGKASKNGKV